MDPRNLRNLTLVCGVSGSGKSTFALRLLLNLEATRFVFDPDAEVATRLRLPAASTATELEEDLGSGWVIFDPHSMFPGKMECAFRFFSEWVFEVSGRVPGRKLFLIDEVWKYCSPYSIPQELALCIQTGRKRLLEMVFCTQRPNQLNESILNETTELVCFRLQGENAMRRVSALVGGPVPASDLPPGSFVSYNLLTGASLAGKVF